MTEKSLHLLVIRLCHKHKFLLFYAKIYIEILFYNHDHK